MRRVIAMVFGPLLACASIGAHAQTAAKTLNVDDSAGGSYVFRFVMQEPPNLNVWPESRSLVPLYDAWEFGSAGLYGSAQTQLQGGEQYKLPNGTLSGPATVNAEADLNLLYVAKKWVGGFDGGELEGMLGLGMAQMRVGLTSGFVGRLHHDNDAGGLIIGLGMRNFIGERVVLTTHFSVFSSNPIYLFGSGFASGRSNEGSLGEIGVFWPKGGRLAVHGGMQAVRYVPKFEAGDSKTELRLWGPFLGLRATLR